MDPISVFIGLILMGASIIVGYRMREEIHAILPIRDPVFVSVIVAEVSLMLADAIGVLHLGMWATSELGEPALTDLGSVVLLCFAAVDAGYVLGYVMSRPGDVLILDMPDDTLTYSEVRPVVYYRKNGNLYIMPQTFGGVVASFLGARHPADMPVYEISRQRTYSVSNGIQRTMTLAVIPVSLHEMETITIGLFRIGSRKIRDDNRNIIAETPVYLWHPEVTSHRIRFSQTVTDDHLAYWVKHEIYKTSIEDAIDAEERAARLEIQMQSAKYDAGADLVSGLVSLSTDAEGCQEEILRRIAEERRRRGGEDSAEHSG